MKNKMMKTVALALLLSASPLMCVDGVAEYTAKPASDTTSLRARAELDSKGTGVTWTEDMANLLDQYDAAFAKKDAMAKKGVVDGLVADGTIKDMAKTAAFLKGKFPDVTPAGKTDSGADCDPSAVPAAPADANAKKEAAAVPAADPNAKKNAAAVPGVVNEAGVCVPPAPAAPPAMECQSVCAPKAPKTPNLPPVVCVDPGPKIKPLQDQIDDLMRKANKCAEDAATRTGENDAIDQKNLDAEKKALNDKIAALQKQLADAQDAAKNTGKGGKKGKNKGDDNDTVIINLNTGKGKNNKTGEGI